MDLVIMVCQSPACPEIGQDPALLFMAEMILSGDFSLAPLEAGILLDHPVEAQSINRRKIGKKSGYLPPFFFPWVSSLFLVISALTPWSKS